MEFFFNGFLKLYENCMISMFPLLFFSILFSKNCETILKKP